MTVEYIVIPRGLSDIVSLIFAAGVFRSSRRYSMSASRHQRTAIDA